MSEASDPDHAKTRFHAWPRWACVLALLLIAALAVGGVLRQAPAATITEGPAPQVEDTDWELYRAVLARLQAGEPYYDALGTELRTRGYPTRSVFNWRTPLHLSLLGRLPTPRLAQALLVAVALLAAGLAFPLLRDVGGRRLALGATALFAGAVLPCVIGDIQLFGEVWAGTLIVCSALLLAHRYVLAGVALGITALFMRELALLHCGVALALAVQAKRRKEVLAWGLGLLAWGLYFGVHAWVVTQRLTPADPGFADGWIQFNGLAFVLATARMHAFLLVLPTWCTALAVPLALAGLAGWPDDRARGLRLTGLGFAAAFAVVGRPTNFYWGPLYVPLLALGIAWAPRALRDLVAGALRRPSP